MDLFFITDTREILHTNKRQEEIIDRLKAILGDAMMNCEIEQAGPEVTACLQSFLPPFITEDMFSLELPGDRSCSALASDPLIICSYFSIFTNIVYKHSTIYFSSFLLATHSIFNL